MQTNSLHSAPGFTLIEVLVAIVILTVGILGLAGLQGTALQNTHSAHLRSQAVNLAHDIAERMRSNRATALQNSTNYQIDLGVAPTAPGKDCAITSCTAMELAAYDKDAWYRAVSQLPEGKGSVAIDVNTRIANITIQWADNLRLADQTVSFPLQAQL